MAARILNKSQAEAVYNAMCELNNVNGLLLTHIRTDSGHFIEVNEDGDGMISVRCSEVGSPPFEAYPSQYAFSAAYGLNPDEPQSAVAAAAGGLTQTAIEC
ncbi:hypothetical protein CCO03_08555 [Comamonas serinivorans]|uniref:Uncharacterized protein n=1 Tax=Comamonas serinivorans TaxID=1082851 RepID=A0A1Y0EM97_9BURK|nr:hypothetical protein [Comamonas serinivorans]ARU04717.1 hypothetical protein CCO03_08555 [Comamonas serinivorans]